MQAASKDGSFVFVGSTGNRGFFSLMGRKDLNNIREVKGKRIAVSQIGDAPYNYTIALLGKYGIGSRDVEWIPVGTDVSGRAAALQGGRADATLLTAPNYFRLEEAGFKNLANMSEHEDIFASTTLLMTKASVAANPKLPEQFIKAEAEAIKRFYEDKAFAIKAYAAFDKQPEADVARIYEQYVKNNAFERIPYVLAGAIKSVIDQQADPRIAADLKAFDFRKVVDNSYVDRLAKEGYFEKLFGPGIKPEETRKSRLAFR
jgi:ABC-type nitrate/sulfonate/bicarbonate transport system substrate-binding protein